MMFSGTAGKSAHLNEAREITRDAGKLISRKIWLPRLLYNSLPCFYFVSGAAALLATLYISDWYWILPHYLLFAAACLHMGLFVYRRRHRRRT